jgi:hypothetical protein
MARRGQTSGNARTVVGVRVDPPEREALRRLAAADGCKPSDLMRESLSRYLAARADDLVEAS